MERRDLLKLGIAGVAAAGSGCAAPFANGRPAPPPLTHPEARALIEHLDRGRASIPARLEGAPPLPAREAELMERTFDALFVNATFRDLPEAARAHPEVQARMWSAMPGMDAAVLGMAGYLHSQAGRAGEIQQALRRDPELVDRLGEFCERHAAELGLSIDRRLQLRSAVKQVAWRLQNQPPSLLFDECVGKVRHAVATHGATPECRRAFEAQIGPVAQNAPAPTPPPLLAPAPDPDPATGGSPPPPPLPSELAPAGSPPPPLASIEDDLSTGLLPCEPKGADPTLTAGGVLMGLAAAAGLLILVNVGIFPLLSATAAVVLLASGLVVLIVGWAVANSIH